MSIGAVLVIVGLLLWLLTAYNTVGIVLLVVGVLLLVLPNFAGPRRWYW